MPKSLFQGLVILLGLTFAIAFAVIIGPPLLESGDVAGAFAAGFVNPYSSGYALDAIITGLILIVWVIYERQALGVRHGWIAIPLCFIPGVAVALAYYLVIRLRTARE